MRIGLFVTLLGMLVSSTPSSAFAQTVMRTARVGILSGASITHPAAAPLFKALFDELRLKGWEEGRNLVVEARNAEGRAELYPARATELVALSPDVIVATNSQAVGAVIAHTSSIPIVMIDVSHPVEAGFVKSLANPGSNVTGVTNQHKDIALKHYDLLRVAPNVERLAMLFTPSNAGSVLGLEEQVEAARQIGITSIPIPFEGPADLASAAETLQREKAQALQIHTTPVTIINRIALAKLANEHALPTISFFPVMVRGGLLMSYGAERFESWRRAAGYVDRILRGEQPSSLPVEQPTKFELVINLTTAKALGLTIPPTLLARADEVIE
jgi:putative ABC transport system substrate-binding protein